MDVTFASLITPAGTIIAGGLVTAFVELLKRAFPIIDARVSGASLAFLSSAALYIFALYGLTAAVGAPASADVALNVFVAWLSAATSAVGIKATIRHGMTANEVIATDEVPKD